MPLSILGPIPSMLSFDVPACAGVLGNIRDNIFSGTDFPARNVAFFTPVKPQKVKNVDTSIPSAAAPPAIVKAAINRSISPLNTNSAARLVGCGVTPGRGWDRACSMEAWRRSKRSATFRSTSASRRCSKARPSPGTWLPAWSDVWESSYTADKAHASTQGKVILFV